jgi:hypothetical protein
VHDVILSAGGAASDNVSVATLGIRLGQETSEAVAALLAEQRHSIHFL